MNPQASPVIVAESQVALSATVGSASSGLLAVPGTLVPHSDGTGSVVSDSEWTHPSDESSCAGSPPPTMTELDAEEEVPLGLIDPNQQEMRNHAVEHPNFQYFTSDGTLRSVCVNVETIWRPGPDDVPTDENCTTRVQIENPAVNDQDIWVRHTYTGGFSDSGDLRVNEALRALRWVDLEVDLQCPGQEVKGRVTATDGSFVSCKKVDADTDFARSLSNTSAINSASASQAGESRMIIRSNLSTYGNLRTLVATPEHIFRYRAERHPNDWFWANAQSLAEDALSASGPRLAQSDKEKRFESARPSSDVVGDP